jgi:hypothetical protein
MRSHLVWHELDPDDGVLELDETLTAPGPPLELHVVQASETGATAAWWADDQGAWLRVADVGRGEAASLRPQRLASRSHLACETQPTNRPPPGGRE